MGKNGKTMGFHGFLVQKPRFLDVGPKPGCLFQKVRCLDVFKLANMPRCLKGASDSSS